MKGNIAINLKFSNILKKGTLGLLLNILIRVKGVILVPILVNIVNKYDMGTYSLLLTYSSFFVGLVLLNLPDAANRFILKSDKFEKVYEIISSIYSISLILFVILLSIIIVLNLLFSYKSNLFIFALVCLLFSKVIFKLSIFYFEIYQKLSIVFWTNILVEYGFFVFLGVFYLFSKEIDFTTLVFMFSGATILVSLYLIYTLYCIEKIKIRLSILPTIDKELIKVGLLLLPVAYCNWIIQSSDYLLVDYFLGTSALADYNFSYSLSSIVLGFSIAINFFWYSYVVIVSEEKFQDVFSQLIYVFFLISIASICFYFFLTEYIINLINKEYLSSVVCVNVLVPGFIANIFTQIYSGILYAQKKEKNMLINWIFGAIVNVVLNFVLIPKYGILGSSFSTTISYISVSLLFLLDIRKLNSYSKFILSLTAFKLLILSYSLIIFIINLKK